jgi:hypothetical protein
VRESGLKISEGLRSTPKFDMRPLLALEISEFTRGFARAGIRADHPDWDREQIERELLGRCFFPNPPPAGFRESLSAERS